MHRPRWVGQETLQGQRLVIWDSLDGHALAGWASPRRTLGGGRLIQRPIPTTRRRLEHTATPQEQIRPPSAAASPLPVGLVEASIKLNVGPVRTEGDGTLLTPVGEWQTQGRERWVSPRWPLSIRQPRTANPAGEHDTSAKKASLPGHCTGKRPRGPHEDRKEYRPPVTLDCSSTVPPACDTPRDCG